MKAKIDLPDEKATIALGASLAVSLPLESGGIIGLEGMLGAGKTTLVRGLLRALHVTGTIRSPTYTLVEPYETSAGMILHVDLYRLTHGGEFPALGLDDYAYDRCWWLVEWPDRAGAYMPSIMLKLGFQIVGTGRVVQIDGPDTLVEGVQSNFGG